MSKNPLWLIVSAALVAMLLPSSSYAQSTDAALTGQVTSAEEGAMEGVLVSAKKGTITITVVSDEEGRYSFPAEQARARRSMRSRIRAIGYDLDNRQAVEVGAAGPPPTISSCARPKTSPRSCRTANGCTAFPAPTSRRAAAQLRRLPHARARHALAARRRRRS